MYQAFKLNMFMLNHGSWEFWQVVSSEMLRNTYENLKIRLTK